MAQGTVISELVYTPTELIVQEAIANGFRFTRHIQYPSQADRDRLPLDKGKIEYHSVGGRGNFLGVLRTDPGIIELSLSDGFFRAHVYARSDEDAVALIKLASENVPRSELDTDEITVTFWTLGPNGPVPNSRRVMCPQWADVEYNYTASTRRALESLMASNLDPVQGGKLVLWHGRPGTGKTYALRAWGRMWRSMMDIHYIVDPEVFFGAKALYMVNVLLGQGDDPGTGNPRWRLIVAEDTGELLTKDAKARTGQSLSRLLNVCDGLIGQGLRSLVLITTNEELGEMHEAVTRPGRCLANIGFGELQGSEIEDWYRIHQTEPWVLGRATVAELYAGLKEANPISTDAGRKVGFGVR